MGAAVLSHFLLDLIVHRPDLPLLLDDSCKVGLGLWNHVTASYLAEAAVLVGGLWIYLRATTGEGFGGGYGVVILTVVLLLLSAANFAGPAPPSVTALAVSGLAGYVVITGAAFWLDGKRQ